MASRRAKKSQSQPQELFTTSGYGHFYVPNEVVRFLVGLTRPKSNEKVLAIGFDELGLNSILDKDIGSQIISSEKLPSEEQENSIGEQSFDVILCAPRFGVVSQESNESSEEMWLKWSIEHLSEKGRLAIVVPIGLLSNYSQEPIRRFLIENGGLEAVIEAPAGWALGTQILASILYITTNLAPDRPVRMFRFSDSRNVPWSGLETEVHKTEPKLPDTGTGTAYVIPASKLDSTRLDAKYYDPVYDVAPPGPSFEAVTLVEIVDIRSGERFLEDDFEPQGIPFVQIRNIGPNGTLNLRDVKTIKPNRAADSRSYGLPNDILISIAGTIGKVTLVPPQMNVCIDTSLRRLRVKDEGRVLPEYLALYLQSGIARLQMEKWFSGSVIKVLSSPNLEQLIVYLPSIEGQRVSVQTYRVLVRERQEQLLVAFPEVAKMQSLAKPPAQINEIRELPLSLPKPMEKSLVEVVQKEFPYPLARAYTVLESSANESAFSKLKKLITVSEAVVYYLFGILAADHLFRMKSDDTELKALLNQGITDYSIDKRIKYVSRHLKLAKQVSENPLFVPELVEAELGICAEVHNQLRNIFSHADISEAWCKKGVAEYHPKVRKLLQSLIPLHDYRLAQVTNVTVRDGRPQHHIITMMGDNSLFQTEVEDLDILLPADTQHIVLLDQNYNVLDLHPFYMLHAWDRTGLQDHLCVLKQVVGQAPKQRLKLESTQGGGETEVDMDLKFAALLVDRV